MNLANWITTLRIVLALVCVFILFWDIPGRDTLAAIIFIIAGITDGVDGYAARTRKEITPFGKWFDPFADKVLIILTLVVLAHLNRGVPWLAVWIISGREVLITVLRYFAGKKGLMNAASRWGKLKTFSQIIAISLIMLAKPWHLETLSVWVLWFAVILTIWSGFDYLWRWRSVYLSSKSKDVIVKS